MSETIDWDEMVTVEHLGFDGEVVFVQRLPRYMLWTGPTPSAFVDLDGDA